MIIYFSGTGNSRYCAQMIAELTHDRLLDSLNYIKDQIAPELISSEPWVFVCPTYAWQIPHIFKKFLQSGSFSGAKEAYFLMTCGSDIGCAEKSNADLCQELGLQHMGTMPIVMPENYVAMFPVPDEEESAKIIKNAHPVIRNCAEFIRSRKPFPQKKHSFIDTLKSGPINAGFNRFYLRADKFCVTDNCIHCGKCAEVCPLNNITLKEGMPVWSIHCTHCMACICSCPAEAIEYGKISKGKPRYQCPPYSPTP